MHLSAHLDALKQDLALACRMLAEEHLFDQSGHVSARHPSGDLVLVHPHPLSRFDVQAADILTVDMDGHVVEGSERAPSEIFIHTRIYKARPDVQSVCHTHSRMAVVFTIAERPLHAVTNNASFLGDEPVPVYPNPRLVRSAVQGDALAECLGQRVACLMRSHGAVVVGPSIRDAFVGAVYLEENAQRAFLAAQIGEPRALAPDERRDVAAAGWAERPLQKAWDYYVSRARRAGLA